MQTQNINMGITAFPIDPPPPKPVEVVVEPTDIDPKLLAIMKKYKYNWRLNQLSKRPEFKRARKYVKQPEEMIKATPKKEIILEPEVEFRSDHLSRMPLRYLIQTRKAHRKLGKTFNQNMKKYIRNTWNSIYNYYRLQERRKACVRRLKPVDKPKKGRSRKSIEKERKERIEKLATPKRVFEPEPGPPKKIRPIEDSKEHLDQLAMPKVRVVLKEKKLGVVKPDALTYEITPAVMRLATTIPKRYREKPEVIVPGKVTKAALKYKISERITAMAVPKVRKEQKTVDDEDDPWVISPNALKYKATPRMLELAKPKERE